MRSAHSASVSSLGTGLFTGLWLALALGLACVVAGHAVGRRAFARLDGARYEPLLLALVTAAGLASVAGGVL